MKKRPVANGNYLAIAVSIALVACILNQGALGQNQSKSGGTSKDRKQENASLISNAVDGAEADPYFRQIYRNFFESYRVGPEDEIAIRVVGQPDYTLEKASISPFGRVYHPLVGDIDVAGLTITQVTDKVRLALSEYIIDPKVSVSLLSANSAKIGVLGDVTKPGIVVMDRPMTVLDALSACGGVTDHGRDTNVTVLRQVGEGRTRTMTVNVKHILQAKAGPEENVTLQAGDTIIVHGNFKKALGTITQLTGFGYFIRVLAGG